MKLLVVCDSAGDCVHAIFVISCCLFMFAQPLPVSLVEFGREPSLSGIQMSLRSRDLGLDFCDLLLESCGRFLVPLHIA